MKLSFIDNHAKQIIALIVLHEITFIVNLYKIVRRPLILQICSWKIET